MASLRIENNLSGGTPTINYNKNLVPQSPIGSMPCDDQINEGSDVCEFHIEGDRVGGNSILVAFKDVTHAIEMMDKSDHMIVRISPIAPLITPDILVKSCLTLNPTTYEPDIRLFPNEISFTNSSKMEIIIKLKVTLNNNIFTLDIVPGFCFKVSELGFNGYIDFEILNNIPINYRLSCLSNLFPLEIILRDKINPLSTSNGKYSLLSLKPFIDGPNNINITIVPD